MTSDIINSIDKYLSGSANEEQKATVDLFLKKLSLDKDILTSKLTVEELKNVSAKMWEEIHKSLLLMPKETIEH